MTDDSMVFAGCISSIRLLIVAASRSGSTLSALSNPAALPAGESRKCRWSADGTYVAVPHDGSPFVTIYSRSGDTFTKLTNPGTLPPSNGFGCSLVTTTDPA